MDLGFDPRDPAFRADPYPAYKALRETSPCLDTGAGVTILSRYEDCLAVLRHPSASSDFRKGPGWATPPDRSPDQFVPSFLNLDPPDHTRLRGLVSRAFTPRRVEELRAQMVAIVDELLDGADDAGELDLLQALAAPFPTRVICALLGVPSSDIEQWRRWAPLVTRTLDHWALIDPEDLPALRAAVQGSWDYFEALTAARQRRPGGDDLVSALLGARDRGDRLTGTEIVRTLTLLMVAGHETTVNLIANAVLAFARHPGELARLRSDPSLARSAVEEALRFDPPVQADHRLLLEDLPLSCGTVRRDSEAILLLAAANRDPSQFDDPDRFDIGRGDNRHLSFGFGIHHCLGAPLARAEGEIALLALARRFAGFELVEDPPPYRPHFALRGVRSLRVRLERRDRLGARRQPR